MQRYHVHTFFLVCCSSTLSSSMLTTMKDAPPHIYPNPILLLLGAVRECWRRNSFLFSVSTWAWSCNLCWFCRDIRGFLFLCVIDVTHTNLVKGHFWFKRNRYEEIKVPTTILRAEKGILPDGPSNSETGDFSTSATDPDLANLFAAGVAKDVHLKDGMTHFIPMQRPDLVANYIGDFLASSSKL